MAQIISISLNDDILKDMDVLQKDLGFSGRSEIVRAGIRNLIEEHKKISEVGKDDISNKEIEGTMIVTHHENSTDEFSKIKHSVHNIVKTHIHHELKEHKCMEIMLFKGKGKEILKLYKSFMSSRKIDSVKVIIS